MSICRGLLTLLDNPTGMWHFCVVIRFPLAAGAVQKGGAGLSAAMVHSTVVHFHVVAAGVTPVVPAP